MLTSLGLFAYGVLALFALSAMLTAASLRLSRRAVLTRGGLVLSLVAGTGLLAWLDQAGKLTAATAWSATAFALIFLVVAAWSERRQP